MKKVSLLFTMLMISVMSFGQTVFTGVNWVTWANEPDYEGVTGYAENPYEHATYTIFKAPASWTPVSDVASFDATWEVLGDEQFVANPGNIPGGDLYDLGAGKTFGASWKAVHDGERVYILLKYLDVNAQADDGTRSFEIMAQPKDPIRHESTFEAGVAAEDMAKKNMAYGRYVELGGGKAMFVDGNVTEYQASIGMTGQWGANGPGLEAFLDLEDYIFWDVSGGVIRAVLPMDFAGVLSYPDDPTAVSGARTALAIGDVFAFDVKTNSKVGGENTEYWWSANKNNGYASNYYSGHVTLSATELGGDEEVDVAFTGVNWIGWANEPSYEGVVGYAENPYANPTYTVFKAPASWSPVSDMTSFDATWNVLGEAQNVAKPTDIRGGDLFDLGAGNTFGSSWKAVHDGDRMYVLLKYVDMSNSSATPLSFEVMAQPKSPVRHEPTFKAGVAAEDMAKKNMAYGRYVELGGGKAMFVDGNVTEYQASIGMTGQWGANSPGLEAFLDLEDYVYWEKVDGVVRAVLPMDFAGVLSYPVDPREMTGARTALKVGDTFAFDVKSNARIGGTEDANRVEYFWAADQNNGYGSNYYSGHLTLSATEISSGPALVLNVKMGYFKDIGKFNATTDFVDVAGSFNGWDGVNHRLTAVNDADMTYTVTIPDLEVGTSYDFKFRINGSWDDETSEFPAGGPNRTHLMTAGANVYTAWYNDQERGTNVDELPTAKLGVYPNPARDILNIVSSDIIQEVRLINAIGQLVYSQVVGSESVQLPVGGFDKGLYLVQILSSRGVSVERVLISR